MPDYGILRVTTPDGQVREYPIDGSSAILGRADGNRIVIDHVSLSRRHAHIFVDADTLMIEDMGSANGTFIGSQQLPPNTPRVLEPGEPLRFGDVEAVLLRPGAPVGPQPPAPAEATQAPGPPAGVQPQPAAISRAVTPPPPPFTSPPPPAGPSSPLATPQAEQDPRQWLGVTLTSPSAPVAPGSSTSATLAVQNRGAVVDEVGISVPDLPPEWVRVTRSQIPLLPGARDEVNIVISPPRTPTSVAGEREFTASVLSREHRVEVRALGRLTILPFEGLTVAIRPVRGRGDFRVEANNQGNAPATVTLNGLDDEGVLDFHFSENPVVVGPGEVRVVQARVRPRDRRSFGDTQTRPFRIEAATGPGPAQKAAVEGQLMDRPPLQAWRWLLAGVVLAALLGGGAFAYTKVCESSWPVCGGEKDSPPPATPTVVAPTVAGPTPARTTAPPATVRPSPTGAASADPCRNLKLGGQAQVTEQGNNLFIRTSPVRQDQYLIQKDGKPVTLPSGTKVKLNQGCTNDGSFLFWEVAVLDGASAGLTGWVAERSVGGDLIYLVPLP